MTIMRRPILTSIDPELAGNGEVVKGLFSKNVLFSKYGDNTVYATQRPGLSIREIATDTGGIEPIGRGVVYWDAANAYYFVNNDTVYAGGYSSPLAQNITAGRDPVTLLEIGTYLVILDRENNEGWYIAAASPTTLLAIADTDFPGNIPNTEIAGGGAVLDGTLYVMDSKGLIYGSDINDPTSWDGLNVIGVTREQDTGIYLTKHHDHIVAIGVKSIEFFYDNANSVGSPLERRSDISYRTGATDAKSVYNTGDLIYFFGAERTGTAGLFQIERFTLSKVSTDSIDTFMSITRARTKYDFIISGATIGEHKLVFITSVAPNGTTSWTPTYTLVYDGTARLFTQFEASIAGVTAFGVVNATERSSVDTREATLMFLSGDIGFFDLTFNKIDSAGSQIYCDSDYIVQQDDYILDIGQDATSDMEMILLFQEFDLGGVVNKFGYRMSVVGTTTSAAVDDTPIMISWSDDHYRTFSTERPLDTGLNRSMTRLGKFRRRGVKLRYTGQDVLRLEAVEMDLRASRYA